MTVATETPERARQYEVRLTKSNGGNVMFARYPTIGEARAIAYRLAEVGCRAYVIGVPLAPEARPK